MNRNVILIGSYGTDKTICQAAKMSYNSNKEYTEEEDYKLLEYMIKHGHTSPFEQVNFSFKLHMPIFVARQWMRHRTAKINEQSGRYTKLNNEFFKLTEENLRSNKEISPKDKNVLFKQLEDYYSSCWELYLNMLNLGVVKEQARTILPLSVYTTFVWQIDLHNLMHFLELRLNKSAQEETREYAKEVFNQVKDICPITMKLFEKYKLCQN